MGVAPDRIAEVAMSVATELGVQPVAHREGQQRAFVNEAGVDLDQCGPRGDLGVGVCGAQNAADADDGKAPSGKPIELADYVRRAITQWPPTQPAALGCQPACRGKA